MKAYRILTVKNDPEVLVRLPQEVYDALNKHAVKRGRSVNMQLVISLVEQLETMQATEYAIPHKDLNSKDFMRLIMDNEYVDFKPAK